MVFLFNEMSNTYIHNLNTLHLRANDSVKNKYPKMGNISVQCREVLLINFKIDYCEQ